MKQLRVGDTAQNIVSQFFREEFLQRIGHSDSLTTTNAEVLHCCSLQEFMDSFINTNKNRVWQKLRVLRVDDISLSATTTFDSDGNFRNLCSLLSFVWMQPCDCLSLMRNVQYYGCISENFESVRKSRQLPSNLVGLCVQWKMLSVTDHKYNGLRAVTDRSPNLWEIIIQSDCSDFDRDVPRFSLISLLGAYSLQLQTPFCRLGFGS